MKRGVNPHVRGKFEPDHSGINHGLEERKTKLSDLVGSEGLACDGSQQCAGYGQRSKAARASFQTLQHRRRWAWTVRTEILFSTAGNRGGWKPMGH